ncbi:MAG TPA: metal-binding protein [Gammaproteobacteria bacterium]|nr:metal-binding protein [Gammaproteobacteria bacterium]
MFDKSPVLSICTSCRDGREVVDGSRGGTRLAQAVVTQLGARAATKLKLRGVQCMSQCKRPCIASLSSHDRFTYVFGDIDPENPDHVDALFELVARYKTTPEGFLKRRERPEALRSNILGRLPPLRSGSSLVTPLDNGSAR